MSARSFRVILLFFGLIFAASVLAQEGHPVKGSWVGEWSPAAAQPVHLVIWMDYDGKNISGTVNPGPNAIPIKLARLDIIPGNASATPPTVPGFKVHIEADTKDAKGSAVAIVADGTMQQVALPNRTITGTWSQTTAGATVKGEFKIRRQY